MSQPFDTHTGERALAPIDLWRMLWRRKWVILLVFLVPTGIAAYVSVTATRVFRAHAKILLKWENNETVILTPAQSASTSRSKLDILASEIQLLTSHEVAERAYRLAYKPQAETLGRQDSLWIEKIKRSISATPVRNTDVIEVYYEDTEPVRAARMVNYILNAYQQFRTEIYKVPGDTGFLANQIEINKKKLDDLRSALDQYKVDHSIVALDEQKRKALQQLTKVESDLIDVSRKRIRLQTSLSQLHDMRSEPDQLGGLPLTGTAGDWSTARHLYNKLVELRMERMQLLDEFTEAYAPVQRLSQEIVAVKSLLEREIDRLLRIEEMELNSIRAEERVLFAEAASLRERLRELPSVEQRFANLQRDIEEYEKIYSTLLRRKEEKRMSAGQTLDELTIRIISPALIPRQPVRPKPVFAISLAATLSLFAGVSLSLLLERHDNSVKSAEQLERLVGIPVLASVSPAADTAASGEFKGFRRRKRPY